MRIFWCVAVAISGMAAGTAANAVELKALVSLPAQHVIEEIVPAFEKNSGHKVNITYTGGQDTRQRMAAGEVFDLIIAARPDIDGYVKDGKLTGESVVDLMKVLIGVAVKPGWERPALTEAGLKQAFLTAKAIGYSTGTSGTFVSQQIFPKLGIAGDVAAKLKQVPSGTSVGTIIASGEVDVGMQQVSELIHFKGIDYVGALPDSLQLVTVYSGAIYAKASQADAAKALISALAAPQANAAKEHAGMTPVR